MKKDIEREDYLKLVEVFANHPDFKTETDRWGLVNLAFAAISGAEKATGNLCLAGHSQNAAVALVGRLLDFGRLGDRHSLSLVLDVLKSRTGHDGQAEIDRLIGVLDGQGTAPRRSNPATIARQADILHLSDLHLGNLDDAQRLSSQLAEDLKRELRCTRLDGMILSGDLTMVCAEDEYAAARSFVQAVAGEFGLAGERIVLVPGNHDLSWPRSKAAYRPGKRVDYLATDDAGKARWIIEPAKGPGKRGRYKVRDEPLYRERFRLFSDELHEPITGAAYPLQYAEQFRLHHWPDLGLLVLGLNSAWEIDHHYKDRAAIHPLAAANALNALRARPDWEGCLKIGVWHHPLSSDEPSRIVDHGFVERLAAAGFRLGLHGHIHKTENGQFRYDQTPGGRRMDILAAGTFGAPSRQWVDGYPAQYQLLRFDGRRLSVETRRREKQNGPWKPDARWLQGPDKDPLPRYGVDL